MVIHNGFYLNGFTRIDKGEAGAVFVHYAEDREGPAQRAPEIKAAPAWGNTASFTVSIPIPAPRKVTACAIVTRSSKNCYTATVFDERRIETFRESGLDALRRVVAKFFEEAAA